MPSIGNIVVKKIPENNLLPPVYEPIVKGPSLEVVQEAQRIQHAPPSLMGAGGQSPKPHKEVFKFITQTVPVSSSVNKLITGGVVGHSYTQTSFTFESYTLVAGAPTSKSLTESISITEPLAVQRTKTRKLFEDSPQLTELSATLTIERTKARSLLQADLIEETLEVLPQTNLLQTLTETDIISETVTTLKESKRLQTETVSESADVSLELPGVRQILTETEQISDSVVKEITYAAGHIAFELIEDTAITDAVTTTITKTRLLAETETLADSVASQVSIGITSFTETSFTPLSYTIFTEIRTEQLIDEIVDESHTLRIERTKKRPVSDATIIIDSVSGEWISPNDIIVTDEVTFAVGRGRRVTENVDIIG